MPKRKIEPVDRKSQFELKELFFSTTDLKGKIRTGNDVFQRVAKYSLSEMVGEPHSLIRHPDIPRAVFFLLWQYLEAGKPIAAYVKNMASDGTYYWVLAVAVPIPGRDGYLSVRLKPTTKDIFPAVREAYKALREIEAKYEDRGDRRGGLDASVAELPKLLNSLGFADYDDFMSTALSKELEVRDQGLGRDKAAPGRSVQWGRSGGRGKNASIMERASRVQNLLDRQFAQLDGFITLSSSLDEKSRFVSGLARTVRLVSLNAMAASGRLSTAGAPLGVIARAIGSQAEESGELAGVLERHNAKAAHALNHTAFLMGIAKVQMEMVLVFVLEHIESGESDKDIATDENSREGFQDILDCLVDVVKQFFSSYEAVVQELTPLMSELTDLRRLVQTLDITHVTGMVESGRLTEAKGFDALFDQVGKQVNFARIELRDFADAVQATINDIEALAEVETKILRDLSVMGNANDGLQLAS